MRQQRTKLLNHEFLLLIALEIIILFFSLVENVFHRLDVGIGLSFFLFQLFCVFLPGAAMYLLLDCDKHRDIISFLGLTYAYGIMIIILEYYILQALRLADYALWLGGAVSVASLAIIYEKKTDIRIKAAKISSWIYIALVLILLIITLITVSFANTLPDENGGNSYYIDWLFWLGNNISLAKGFPAQSLRLSGSSLYYHYFSSIFVAQTGLITGIDIPHLTFYFSSILPMVTLPAAGYMLFSATIKRRRNIILALIAFLFTSGTSITYEWHLYYCPFGFDYGYIFGIIAIYLLCEMYQENDFSYNKAIIIGAFIAATTGFKGPTALVIMPAFVMVALYLIEQKKYPKGILFGLIWGSAFALVFIFVIGGIGRTQQFVDATANANFKFVSIREQFQNNSFIQRVYQELLDLYYPETRITKLLSVLIYAYRANKAAMTGLIIGTISFVLSLFTRRKKDIIECSLLFISWFGTFLFVFTLQRGYSQMYFVMSTIAFSLILGFRAMENIAEKRWKKILQKVAAAGMILTLSVGVSSFFDTMYGVQCVWDRVANGIKRFRGDVRAEELYVDQSCYETCLWIRDNTSVDSIIAVDYFENENGFSTNQIVGCFSERAVWNDGQYSNQTISEKRKTIMGELLNGNRDVLPEIKQDRVEYILQCRYKNDSIYLINTDAEIVYENDQYRLYKLI